MEHEKDRVDKRHDDLQRVQMRLGREVQPRSNTTAHRINGQIRRIIHIDEVSHIHLIIRPSNGKIIVNLF